MADQNSNYRHGISALDALTILFVALKLTGYINWSWWLVLLPAYGVIAVVFVGAGISVWVESFLAKRRRKKREQDFE